MFVLVDVHEHGAASAYLPRQLCNGGQKGKRSAPVEKVSDWIFVNGDSGLAKRIEERAITTNRDDRVNAA
jgi:hypothetical protein